MKNSVTTFRLMKLFGLGLLLLSGALLARENLYSTFVPSPLVKAQAAQPRPPAAAATAIQAESQSATPEQLMRQTAGTPSVADLLAKAQAEGSVRVIVGLRASFQPEGLLENQAVVQTQRLSIAQMQDSLLSRMTAFNVTGVKQFRTIPFLGMEVDAAGLQFLQSSSEVASIQEDSLQAPSLAESVSLIGAPAAWAAGYSGTGQTVAILDTGVDKNHPFLSGKVVAEACYSTTGSIGVISTTSTCPGGVARSTEAGSGVNCGAPGCEHGTHVAGIAAGRSATTAGVARDANIIAIQVFSRITGCTSGGCVTAYVSDVILGLERVQALRSSHNIAAVNLSLGSGKFTSNCDASQAAYKTAIDNLRSVGIATIVASGNDRYTGALSRPACISTAISVGSTGDGSSSAGSTATVDVVSSFSNGSSFLHLLAPGQWIRSSIPGGGFADFPGTSMAAPHVVGALALLRSKAPNASVEQMLMALQSTGAPITDARNGITKPRIRVDAAATALATTPCSYSIAPTSQSFPASGGMGTVALTTTPGCAATASSNDPFLTITEGSSGTGSRTVSYSVAANPGFARTGTLFIAGHTLNITQSASLLFLGVDDGTDEFSDGLVAGGTSYGVNRLTPTSYPATINAVAIYFPSGEGVQVGDPLTVLAGAHPSGSESLSGVSFQSTAATVQGLDRFAVYSIPPLTISSGDFIVGMRMTYARNVFPFALDLTPPVQRRSYFSTNGTTFTLYTIGNLMMRALLSPEAPCHTVTGISPTSGAVGSSVTITGTNLTGVTAVQFANGVAAQFTVNSATSITATVPSGAVTGPITIRKTGCADVQTASFTVLPPTVPCHTVSSLAPTSGMAGSTVTITGTNFTGVSAVRFANNVAATFTVNSDTQITATVPTGAVTGPITLSKPNCPDAASATFTVVPSPNPAPVLTGLNPGSATAGGAAFTLTLTGTNFVPGAVVRWNNSDRTTNVVSATQLTAAILASDIASPGNASITVFNPAPGGGVSGALPFTILSSSLQCNTVLCFAEASTWCNLLTFEDRYLNHRVIVPGVNSNQPIAVISGGSVNPLIRQYLGCGGFQRSDPRSTLIAAYLAAQLDIQTQLPFWWGRLDKQTLGCHVITPMSMPGMPGAPRALPATLSGGPIPVLTDASSLQDLYDATDWVVTKGSMEDLQKLIAIYKQLNTCRRD